MAMTPNRAAARSPRRPGVRPGRGAVIFPQKQRGHGDGAAGQRQPSHPGGDTGGDHDERGHFSRAVHVVTACGHVAGDDEGDRACQSTMARPTNSMVTSQPAIPATPPSNVNVRTPPSRACVPLACPDRWRSTPIAAPPNAAATIPERVVTSVVTMSLSVYSVPRNVGDDAQILPCSDGRAGSPFGRVRRFAVT